MINVPVKRYRGASFPVRMTCGAAGYDLASNRQYTIKAGESVDIETDIAMAIPKGYEGQVRPRSSMHKIGLESLVSPGTIDSDYRGTIKIPVRNVALHDVFVVRGQRLAQIVFSENPEIRLIDTEALPDTERGAGGFGSTGTGSTGTGVTSYLYHVGDSELEALKCLMRDIQDETTEEDSVKKTVSEALDEIYADGLDLSHPDMDDKNYHNLNEVRVTRDTGFVKADGAKFKLSEFLQKMENNALTLSLFSEALEIIDTAGKTKYSPKNWTRSDSPTPFLDAAYRHIAAHLRSERLDPETGKAHITHALVNLLFAEALKDKS